MPFTELSESRQEEHRNGDSFIRWFSEIGIRDLPLVGGKNASLGEMFRELASAGIKVPNGFAITADAYRYFLSETGLKEQIAEALYNIHLNDLASLRQSGSRIRHMILSADLPHDLETAIMEAYDQFPKQAAHPTDVAVRSSATAEDLPNASFAGQQETYLNVQGYPALLECCKRSFASLFTDRAISYRIHQGFEHAEVALSIGVQQMVRSDLGASGVIFTIDTETGFPDVVLINGSYGLGENVVQGAVNPDEFYVFKPALKQGFRPIISRRLGSKEFKLIYDVGGGKMIKNVPVPLEDRKRFCISDDEILTLAKWAYMIEDHYSRIKGYLCPMDIEWAKDGRTGELFILQARPETVQSRKDPQTIQVFKLLTTGQVLVSGRSVGEKIASGPVRVIKDVHSLQNFREGEILVTDRTDPDWEPIMKKAAAIVTNRGGRTCHAAIVSRELGVPAIVGTENATRILRDDEDVTVSCAEGDTGFVYAGKVPFSVSTVHLEKLGRPQTKVMMNIGNPDEAFALSFIPNDGVGLAREEFIISNYIKVHPLALLDYINIEDPELLSEIDDLTVGYVEKSQFFVDKLADGAATIAAAFYPKDVILRLSDFKTNEYANLIGGKKYEPIEENPMLGFRGASRYYNPRYRAGFALECRAMQKVREEMGLTNLKLMIPFCRTVEEGRQVQAEMEKYGLKRV